MTATGQAESPAAPKAELDSISVDYKLSCVPTTPACPEQFSQPISGRIFAPLFRGSCSDRTFSKLLDLLERETGRMPSMRNPATHIKPGWDFEDALRS